MPIRMIIGTRIFPEGNLALPDAELSKLAFHPSSHVKHPLKLIPVLFHSLSYEVHLTVFVSFRYYQSVRFKHLEMMSYSCIVKPKGLRELPGISGSVSYCIKH